MARGCCCQRAGAAGDGRRRGFLSGRVPGLDKNAPKCEWKRGGRGGILPLPPAHAEGSAKPVTALPKGRKWSWAPDLIISPLPLDIHVFVHQFQLNVFGPGLVAVLHMGFPGGKNLRPCCCLHLCQSCPAGEMSSPALPSHGALLPSRTKDLVELFLTLRKRWGLKWEWVRCKAPSSLSKGAEEASHTEPSAFN